VIICVKLYFRAGPFVGTNNTLKPKYVIETNKYKTMSKKSYKECEIYDNTPTERFRVWVCVQDGQTFCHDYVVHFNYLKSYVIALLVFIPYYLFIGAVYNEYASRSIREGPKHIFSFISMIYLDSACRNRYYMY